MALSQFPAASAGATDEGAISVKSYTLTNGNGKIVGPFAAGIYTAELISSTFDNVAIPLYSYVGATPTLVVSLPNQSDTTSGIFAGKVTRQFTLTSAVDGFTIPGEFYPVTILIKKFAAGAIGGFSYVPNLQSLSFTNVNIGTSCYSMSFAYYGNRMAYGSYSGGNCISNDDGASWGNVLNGDYTVASTDTHFVYVQNGTTTYYTFPHGSFSATQRAFSATQNAYGGNRMAYGNGVLVMFTGSNNVMTTNASAITWTNTTGLAFTADAVCFDGTKFVATAGTSTYSSTNGTSWTLVSTTRPSGFTDIYFGNGMYLVTPSGSTAVYYTSTDLVNWTSRTNPFGAADLNWAIYRNGAWAMGRYGTTPYASLDGINWTSLGLGGTYQGGINNSGKLCILTWSASYVSTSQNRNGVVV